jgi:putative phosphoribosyl transferase
MMAVRRNEFRHRRSRHFDRRCRASRRSARTGRGERHRRLRARQRQQPAQPAQPKRRARLSDAGLGTLLFDLLTVDEERVDAVTREHRFDIALLARRLVAVTEWLTEAAPDARPIGYFGASTGAAAALVAAAALPASVAAIVSRGGRPDLAREALAKVRAPTLLIVGGNDPEVLMLNEVALERLGCRKQLIVIPGATHLFEESGALDAVAHHAAAWFTAHFDGDGHD